MLSQLISSLLFSTSIAFADAGTTETLNSKSASSTYEPIFKNPRFYKEANGDSVLLTFGKESRWILEPKHFTGLMLDYLDEDYVTKPFEVTGTKFSDADFDPKTERIAVGVFVKYQTLVDFSLVFIADPNSHEGGQLVRLPQRGSQQQPEKGSYSFVSIERVKFTEDGGLGIVHSDAAGNEAHVQFDKNMKYIKCQNLRVEEGDGLCKE